MDAHLADLASLATHDTATRAIRAAIIRNTAYRGQVRGWSNAKIGVETQYRLALGHLTDYGVEREVLRQHCGGAQ